MTPARLVLTPIELASGFVCGTIPTSAGASNGSAKTPVAALEDELRPALLRPPCVVAFSGGRDSAAVLAAAVGLARREGLDPPIPATNRFPTVSTTNEAEWQERVVATLGIEDWVKIEHDDELDCVGPIARRLLMRHGLLWPFNAHFLAPLLDVARTGSLLTGLGGDELLGETRWARAATILAGRQRPELRDVRRVALALAPRRVRRRVLASRVDVDLSWLRPDALADVRRSWVEDSASEPFRWSARVRWLGERRYLFVGAASLALLGRDEDVRIRHPLMGPAFVEALAALRSRDRFFTRTDAMRALFAGLLPDDVLARTSKASFDGAFFNRHSRVLVDEWDGSGIDETLVDRNELMRVWRSRTPDARTLLLLQSVWLSQARADVGATSRVGETVSAFG